VPVLVPNPTTPAYTAVTVCVPSASVEVLPDVAEPDASVTGEPNALPSIENCTVPVGVPAPDATLAVKLTAWPYVEGFRLEPTVVVVLAVAGFTTWPPLNVPVLEPWLLSPR
jgi:hypothetical protein